VFAERGYRGASIEEIARRSGVTPPVVYDHFASKQALYHALVERHYADLRQVWFEHGPSDEPFAARIPQAIDAWFRYVEAHPFAGRMLFRDTTGDPEVAAGHRRIQERSRGALLPLLVQEADLEGVDLTDAADVELAWETLRAVLQGLALWWYEHPDVSRDRIVAAAMNAVWLGFERVFQGEQWRPR
jgi:AcrR family transcriptional regulator